MTLISDLSMIRLHGWGFLAGRISFGDLCATILSIKVRIFLLTYLKYKGLLMNNVHIKSMSKTNIYVAIILNALTLGIYSIYWLHMQMVFFNEHNKQERIPAVLVYICYGLLIISFFRPIAHVFYLIYFSFKLILLFAIRKEIHQYYLIPEQSPHWLSAIYTVLFGFLYFIYKINSFHNETAKKLK